MKKENNVKIIQIMNSIEAVNAVWHIYGLGSDSLVYYWVPETREWYIYG